MFCEKDSNFGFLILQILFLESWFSRKNHDGLEGQGRKVVVMILLESVDFSSIVTVC